MSAQDLIANHAALFAIKKPGVQPGYDLEFVSLHDLFARHVSRVTGRSRGDTVVVESAETGKRHETAMPHFAPGGKPLTSAHSR
ncbi:MAG: hypothetical protein ACREV2_10435 [Burkholderiales bacterium]